MMGCDANHKRNHSAEGSGDSQGAEHTDKEFKASVGWCTQIMQCKGLTLRRRTSLAQRLPSDFEKKVPVFLAICIN